MNKLRTLLIFFLSSFCLPAIAASSNINPFTPAPAKADQAVVYIYRPNTMANALYSPAINIDGEFKFYVKNGVSTRLSLSPGEHVFEFQADKTYGELTPLALDLKVGITYFIRVTTALKIHTSTDYQPYTRSFKLSLVAKNLAVKEITECCASNGKKLTTTTEPATEEENNTNDGFSVDKTQNPFSH